MIVGTAGHVDHGKTSLVRALTGVDTDRLAEEKARGISIELGFAYARLDAQDGGEPIGFIDVPGHRKFVQTMIAGAAGIDVGLLVIAADDGPMPQTREHLEILRWLAIPRLVVALSKVDAVDRSRVDTARREIEALLDATPYRGAAIVPLSTVSREGIDALAKTLLAQRGRPEVGDAQRRFRLAIDRAFVLQGIGLVVTGTCYSGRVALDDQLTLLPSLLTARVRGIHAQNEVVGEAHAGQRVALNLAGRSIEKSNVHRGDWIVASTIALESDRIDVQLVANAGADAWKGFDTRNWRSVRFHSGAKAANARVTLLAAVEADADTVIAQVVFETPQHVIAGDRFVLRDASASEGTAGSIAGGVVVDIDVPGRGRRSAERVRFLEVAAAGDARAALGHALEAGAHGIVLARWNATRNTTFTPSDIAGHAVDAESGTTLFATTRWNAMLAHVLAVLAAEHERAPDAVGPGRDRLRRMAAPSMSASTFGALIDALKADGRLSQTAAWLHLPGHEVELSADDRARFGRAAALLHEATEPNNPPRIRDLARALGEDEAALRTTFVRLASMGEVYRVAHDHYFLPATVRGLAGIAADVAAADGVAKAAPFRDRIGVGRKVAIQILEFFDRIGYTRRVGDDHRIIQPNLFDG